MRPVTIRYSHVRRTQERLAIDAVFRDELFGLQKRFRAWIQQRPPAFQLDATFLRHEVDDVQTAWLPLLLVRVRFRIEDVRKTLGFDAIPWNDSARAGFAYVIGSACLCEFRILRHGHPGDF